MSLHRNKQAVAAIATLTLAIAIPVVLAGPFTSNGTQPTLEYSLYPPVTCTSCHSGTDDGHNIRPTTTWSGSLMANAGRDPLFWAALDVANNDLPGIGEWCLRCHSPEGWLEGRAASPTGSPDGCSLLGDIDGANNDFEGLTCAFCHRMEVNLDPPPGQASVYFENGQFWIDDVGLVPNRRGPYDYPGGATPPHPWEQSPYHFTSDHCGNCHNVTNPILTLFDEAGVDTGVPVPIERTFMEWQQSRFAEAGPNHVTCQNCHMPDATHDPAYPSIYADINRSGDLPIHQLAGGNAWIPQVIKGEYPALGRDAELDATTAWAEEILHAAATVEISAPTQASAGSQIDINVRVTNLSGHKLPTGYPEGRRMWLDVVVRDALDQPVWRSGEWDPVTGVLADDPQLKVYEVKPGIWNLNGTNQCDTDNVSGDPLFHFVLNNCIALDNRIPPDGFTGGSDIETRPVNYTYPETAPGSGILVNHDDTGYTVTIPPQIGGELSVEAVLRYQTTSDDYVNFLLDEAVDNAFPDDCVSRSTGTPTMSRGEILHDMWTRYDRSPPVAMATAATEVEIGLFFDGFETGDTGEWTSGAP